MNRDKTDQPMLSKYKEMLKYQQCPYRKPDDYSMVSFFQTVLDLCVNDLEILRPILWE